MFQNDLIRPFPLKIRFCKFVMSMTQHDHQLSYEGGKYVICQAGNFAICIARELEAIIVSLLRSLSV